MKDYYSLLGIETNASQKQIKKNYRLLATKFHPDKNNDPDSASKFVAITEAYDILSNRKSRTAYDLKIWEALKNDQVSRESFKTVVPPAVSLRTRRNLAQQKRSLKYFKANSQSEKAMLLILESLVIVARYVLSVLGTSLLLVILYSSTSQLSDAFENGLGYGIPACILIVFVLYGLYKIIQKVILDFRKDVITFSNSYKLSLYKATIFTLSIFILFLTLYLATLRTY